MINMSSFLLTHLQDRKCVLIIESSIKPRGRITSPPFIDQMLDRLAGYAFYCFLDGYSSYNQFIIALKTRRRQLSLVLMGHFHSEGCH